MFEFFSNIPTMFYYGAGAATSLIFIIALLLFFIINNSDVFEAILLAIFFPITALGFIGVGLAIIYDEIRNIVCRKIYNIKAYEELNAEYLLCSDDELIIKDVSYRDNLKIYKILDEQNIDFTISPAVPWKIFREPVHVLENKEPRSYKLFFDSEEDKATFQFYWESLKDE